MNCLHDFQSNGYHIEGGVLSAEEVGVVLEQFEGVATEGAGSRNLLEHLWCRDLAGVLRGRLSGFLAGDLVAVQCTFFDKRADRNWLVAWHQDLAIPVRERVDDPALGGWSEKEGVTFVQPPASVLERVVAVRLHLDDCGADNGPLRVVPGSHGLGRLTEEGARALREAGSEVVCLAAAGDVLLMRPLLLHASSKATAPRHRRVLHFLYGPGELGFGLEWGGRNY